MHKLKALLLIAALIVFSAAAEAKKIKWDGMRQITVGMTTSQVSKLVGKPQSVYSMNGKLYYSWSSWSYFGGAMQIVSIEFTDGKVTVPPSVPEEAK